MGRVRRYYLPIDLGQTFFNRKHIPAFINYFIGTFQHLLRGFEIFGELRVWGWKRFSSKIFDDRTVK